MGFYKNLIVKSDTTQTWMFSMSRLGECVMYALDADGKPTGFVTGKPREVLLAAIQAVYPLAELRTNEDAAPHRFDSCSRRWRELLAVLQGKQCARKKNALIRARMDPVLFMAFLTYAPWVNESHFKLTDRAIVWDKAHDHGRDDKKPSED